MIITLTKEYKYVLKISTYLLLAAISKVSLHCVTVEQNPESSLATGPEVVSNFWVSGKISSDSTKINIILIVSIT